MIEPAECELDYIPTATVVKARIISLSPEMVENVIARAWWTDPALKSEFIATPIDRHWDWSETAIEHDGKELESEQVGVVTDDGYVQGAMLISRESVPSRIEKDAPVLFVELLFTAPRNRSALRKDGRKLFGGVGSELLRWGVKFSQSLGFHGRLALDGSPDFVSWYQALGFQKLAVEPVVYEGIEYTPMELSAKDAARLVIS